MDIATAIETIRGFWGGETCPGLDPLSPTFSTMDGIRDQCRKANGQNFTLFFGTVKRDNDGNKVGVTINELRID